MKCFRERPLRPRSPVVLGHDSVVQRREVIAQKRAQLPVIINEEDFPLTAGIGGLGGMLNHLLTISAAVPNANLTFPA